MFVAFSVENYRSFKDRVTLNMVAADINSRPTELDSNNVFQACDDLKLLTSAAIYGANASGKSNLVAAIRFMRGFILDSSRETVLRQPIAVAPFQLSTETDTAPSRFEIVFMQEQTIYRYGFLISQERIEEEWLYSQSNQLGQRERYLFQRTGDEFKINKRTFREGEDVQQRTRPNALFLSAVAQWNGKQAARLLEWFAQLTIDSGIDSSRQERRLVELYERAELQPDTVAFVTNLDLGIDDLLIEREPVRKRVVSMQDGTRQTVTLPGTARIRTVHTKYDDQGQPVDAAVFDLFSHESHGTRRLFALTAPILNALRSGAVLIVDEMDARLHPILTCEIIRLFNSPETNPYHAQLIFTTHDTNLLESELFRRDQIWFVEKSRRGESILYSLLEYKARNDAAYEKNYIAGRYGAIPYIGTLSAAIGVDNAEQASIEAAIEAKAVSGLEDNGLPSTPEGYEE